MIDVAWEKLYRFRSVQPSIRLKRDNNRPAVVVSVLIGLTKPKALQIRLTEKTNSGGNRNIIYYNTTSTNNFESTTLFAC